MAKRIVVHLTKTSNHLLCIAWVCLWTHDSLGQDTKTTVKPLPRAHAHNDYRHKRPLLDALECGFCSVEVDVFLVDGKLLVGHSLDELRPKKTLQSLYLDVLLERVTKNKGSVYPDGPAFTLLIDIKTDGRKTYAMLRRVLADYKRMLTSVRGRKVKTAAVTAIISGNRDWQRITKDRVRYAGIDGRLSDLNSNLPAHLLPLISDRWTAHFKWRGKGPFPADEAKKLATIVRKAHAKRRRVRFWATPESPAVWSVLRKAGVDHINTDDLRGLQKFLSVR